MKMKARTVLMSAVVLGVLLHLEAVTSLSPYLDKGYVIAPDQSAARVVVFDAKKAGETPIVWQWRVRDDESGVPSDVQGALSSVDEAKLRDGGETLLVSSSSAGWAEVDVATKRARRCGRAGDNTHSIEKLPDGTLVLAHSTSYNQLQLVWGDMGNLTYKNAYPIYSAHGVEWDVRRNCLWALGYTNLVQLAYDQSAKTLTERKRWSFRPSGHDMRLGRDGKIYFTNWYSVWQFDPDRDEEPRVRYAAADVKGFHADAVYGDVQQVGNANYWSEFVTVRPTSGEPYAVYPVGASKMYKVHWATSYPESWNTLFRLEDHRATVSPDGCSVTLGVKLAVPHATPTGLTFYLNGLSVRHEIVTASGDYRFTSSVMNGSTNTYAVVVEVEGRPETRRTESGSFVARTYEGWFSYDAETEVVIGGKWESEGLFVPDPAPTNEDAEVCLRVLVAADDEARETGEDFSSFKFITASGGRIVPSAYVKDGWVQLPGGGWQDADDWADLKVEFDFASAQAPRVRYSLDGHVLQTVSGESWLAIPDVRRLTAIAFRGEAAKGSFSGARYTFRHSHPIRIPDCSPTHGGGLSVNDSDGVRRFSMTVGNASQGGFYAAFTASSLTDEFIAEDDAIQCAADGQLTLTVDATGASSKFAVIAISPTPIPAGTKLSALQK